MKKLKPLTKTDDRQLAAAVRTSAQQIWQAGLGAFAKAQEEGGKVFAKLVKEGTDLQKRTQKTDKEDNAASSVASASIQTTDKHVSGSWDKLEQVFEDRVLRSLVSLGIPSQQDFQALTKHVEELSKTVEALTRNNEAATKNPSMKAIKRSATKVQPKNVVVGKAKDAATAEKSATRVATKASVQKSAVKKSLKRTA